MFRNYLKVAIRALWRYKMFSVINVLEFTLGMTLCLLILLMMRDQSSYDTFHAIKERIYRVISDVTEEERARPWKRLSLWRSQMIQPFAFFRTKIRWGRPYI
jgi:CRISPR/Cas system-associated exonuclease Cas4 (RecB family)